MTEKQLSDKEKALLILEKASEEFTKCTTEIRKLQESLYALNCAFENASTMLKRCLNEEEYNGNVHKDCADEFINLLNSLNEENKQLRQYKDAIFNWDSSKIIRVNMNTGKVDLVDKVDEE